MKWHPLRLTTPFQSYISGGRAIAERLGKADLPSWQIAETWEVSDVDGFGAIVRDGPLSGHTIRQLAMDYPDDLMGRQWRGPHFPLLTKFIDGAGMLPVHLHADDEAARRLEGAPNGKTEAWHILDAAPGATALVGLRERVDRATLREALLRQDYDSVMRRLPVRAGETIHMPGGTLHSFGPNTLIYEIQQTSNIGQHATPYTMDGSWLDPETWHSNIDMLLEELKPDSRPTPHPGLRVRAGDDIDRTFCCASPYFALERWRAGNVAPMRHTFETAVIVSNLGAPVTVTSGSWSSVLGRAETLLLPACLGGMEIIGPADVLVGYLPDLEKDVRTPLVSAGYDPAVIASLGEGLDDAARVSAAPRAR